MFSLKLVRGAEMAEGVRAQAVLGPARQRFLIGRDPACDWHIPDRTLSLSARHCEIVWVDGQPVLRDLSTNGTFVNGASQRMGGEHRLRAGDRVAFGPYLIEVHPSAAAEALAAAPADTAPPAAPRRGGDPAAGLPAETLFDDEVRTGFTRIAKPPPRQAGDARAATAVTPPGTAVLAAGAAAAQAAQPTRPQPVAAAPATPANPAAPVVTAVPSPEDLLAHLAKGLGLPVQALASRPPAETAEGVGALLRAAVEGLRRQLEQQARVQRQLGSRELPLLGGRGAGAALRAAASDDDALRTLLDAGTAAPASLTALTAELAAQPARQLEATRAALRRLGDDLAPDALERVLGADGASAADPAARALRLWALYRQLWPTLGRGEGGDWAEGFVELATLYLAAAYDARPPERA